jgi:hypothetical protein
VNEQIQNADSIKIGDQSYEISEILNDDKLSTIISDALNDPLKMAELEKSLPELAKYVKDNKTELTEQLANLPKSEGLQELAGVVSNNKGKQTIHGVDILPNFMNDLYGKGWDTQTTDMKEMPVWKHMRALGPTEGAAYVSALNELYKTRPGDAKFLASMPRHEMIELGFDTSAGLAKYMKYKEQQNMVRMYNDPSLYPDMTEAIFGLDTDAEFKGVLSDYLALKKSNPDIAAQYGSLMKLIDADSNGETGGVLNISKNIKKLFKTKDLQDGTINTDTLPDISDVKGKIRSLQADIKAAKAAAAAQKKLDDAAAAELKKVQEEEKAKKRVAAEDKAAAKAFAESQAKAKPGINVLPIIRDYEAPIVISKEEVEKREEAEKRDKKKIRDTAFAKATAPARGKPVGRVRVGGPGPTGGPR